MIRDKCFQQNLPTTLRQTSDLRLDAAYLMSEHWPEPAGIGWTSYGCRVTVVGRRVFAGHVTMFNTGSII